MPPKTAVCRGCNAKVGLPAQKAVCYAQFQGYGLCSMLLRSLEHLMGRILGFFSRSVSATGYRMVSTNARRIDAIRYLQVE